MSLRPFGWIGGGRSAAEASKRWTEAPLITAQVENELKARGPVCNFCEEKLTPKQAFCGKCGHPTELANHDERVLWELGQWEVSRRKSVKADPSAARASESASRTRELFKSARVKTAENADTPQAPPPSRRATAPERRSFASRFRQVAPPDAVPAAPSTRTPIAPPAGGRSTDDPNRDRSAKTPGTLPPPPARSVERPAAAQSAAQTRTTASRPAPPREAPAPRPAAPTPPAAAPARPAAPASRRTPTTPERPVSRPAAAKTVTSTRPVPPTKPNASSRPTGTRVATATPPSVERPQAAPVQPPEDSPFIVVRKAPEADRTTHAPPKAAPPKPAPSKPAPSKPQSAKHAAPAAATQAPPKPSRADRKAEEAQRREAERAAKERAKEADQRRAQAAKDEERRRKEQAKEASKRERKHRRHSKRVNRRVVSLDLRNGERVSLSIEGWSRFRRATLVVTNYRVALITRVPPQVRWIPLEEVATVRRRWRGVHSLVISCPIEVLSLQKRKRQMLASFEQLLSSEVAEARTVGSVQRHHADITQEYSDRATEIWDSRFHRLRLWIRRHPAATAAAAVVCVAATVFLLSFLTSAFSPVR